MYLVYLDISDKKLQKIVVCLDNVLPVLETMMKSILSKDLLYPPLKELSEKYPEWLADHRQNLSEQDFDNYNKQYEIVKKLVETFDQKDHEFEQIFELMQKMQALGHPPTELVGNNEAFAPPKQPSPEDCKIQ